MDPARFALVQARMRLALLIVDLLEQAADPATNDDVRAAIELELPTLDQDKRDLDLRIAALDAGTPFPPPSDAILAEIQAAVAALAQAIATDQQAQTLIGLAGALMKAAKKVG